MKREEVYKRIDGERDYQDKKWGGREHDEKHSLSDWIDYMYLCLDRADIYEIEDDAKVLNELRQVVALGIACMEIYGVPERVITLPENYV